MAVINLDCSAAWLQTGASGSREIVFCNADRVGGINDAVLAKVNVEHAILVRALRDVKRSIRRVLTNRKLSMATLWIATGRKAARA